MRDKIKIVIGACIIATISCLAYYGLFKAMIWMNDRDATMIIILGVGTMVLLPFSNIIIHFIFGWLCRKRLGFSSFECKLTLLISCFLYAFEMFLGITPCGQGLGFEDGLCLVLMLYVVLIITVLEVLFLIGFLAFGATKRNLQKETSRQV